MIFILKSDSQEAFVIRFQNIMEYCLNPVDFLKDSDKKTDYICHICYNASIQVTKCEGPCQNIFCMKCLSDWVQLSTTCTSKCGSQYQIKPLSQVELSFLCPYQSASAQACGLPINSLKDFNNHYKVCSFAPADELHKKKMKSEYRCLHKHQLEFFIGSFE